MMPTPGVSSSYLAALLMPVLSKTYNLPATFKPQAACKRYAQFLLVASENDPPKAVKQAFPDEGRACLDWFSQSRALRNFFQTPPAEKPAEDSEDFWAIRARVPGDVLR